MGLQYQEQTFDNEMINTIAGCAVGVAGIGATAGIITAIIMAAPKVYQSMERSRIMLSIQDTYTISNTIWQLIEQFVQKGIQSYSFKNTNNKDKAEIYSLKITRFIDQIFDLFGIVANHKDLASIFGRFTQRF